MRLFAAFCGAGSLTQAARRAGVPKQTLSRRLAGLQEALQVELVRRTSRSVTLTDVGRAYAARCVEVIRLADEANLAASSQLDIVRGELRVSADHTFGESFLPALIAAYAKDFPELTFTVELSSRKVDLINEGFDLAFRIGAPPNVGHLAATRLGPARLWTVASPGYLANAPALKAIADLDKHACISLAPASAPNGWPMQRKGKLIMQRVRPRLRVNGMTMARHAALAGLGVTQLPEFVAAADVARGELQQVLAAHTAEVGGVHVVYPHSRLLAPKVSEFVARAVAAFEGGALEGEGE